MQGGIHFGKHTDPHTLRLRCWRLAIAHLLGYTLQPWVVPCTSIFTILSSSEVCAVTRQLPNRYQSYDLESPWMRVVSNGPIAAISSDTSRFSQRVTVVGEMSMLVSAGA